MSSWDWLILGGGVLEAVGVVTVVVDVWLTRREVERYERRDQTVYPGTIDARAQVFSPTVRLEGGREPTLEERMASLEDRVRQLADDVVETDKELRTELRDEIAEAGSRTEMGARDRFNAIDTLLKGITKGGIPLRLLGVAFVLAGIGLSVAGSLVS